MESRCRKESTSVLVAVPLRRGEAHLIGSSFLLLDTLLVDGHCSVVGRGRVVILVGYVAGALLLGRRVTGDGREDGSWKNVLKRREHLSKIRLARRRFKVVTVLSARAIVGEVEMDANLRKRLHISRTHSFVLKSGFIIHCPVYSLIVEFGFPSTRE